MWLRVNCDYPPDDGFLAADGKKLLDERYAGLQTFDSMHFRLSYSKAIYNFNWIVDDLMKKRTRAIYENGVLKPLKDLNLQPGEEVDIEISNSVRSTKGIIKLDPAIARDIADSDDCTFLEE